MADKMVNYWVEKYREEQQDKSKRASNSSKYKCRECNKFIHRIKRQHYSNFARYRHAKICRACHVALGDVYRPECSGVRRIIYDRLLYGRGVLL